MKEARIEPSLWRHVVEPSDLVRTQNYGHATWLSGPHCILVDKPGEFYTIAEVYAMGINTQRYDLRTTDRFQRSYSFYLRKNRNQISVRYNCTSQNNFFTLPLPFYYTSPFIKTSYNSSP